MSEQKCPKSQREDGDHCDHSWTHDVCHWCGARWGEGGLVERPATYDGTPAGGNYSNVIGRSNAAALGG